ncbi:Hsp70 family protein [Fimbriiglobus ruber]|uniref:Chaperone protein DnaK n=1 Tax=Fimbriiglobus ruber TaxID=1908690 RepID=A0A225D2Q1_9BACT|nr:Hsp70 family protein [Fimbriiglobus ruber]OWK35870.1 Chaperone protein DnaK [Fimbriiglobus ruber]
MIVGIDLGTTYCAVSHLDERGRPVTIPNRDGEILTPSAIYLANDEQAVVGQPALDMALEQPDRVAMLIKRRMGLPDYGRLVAGRVFRPETLSAVILRKLVMDAEAQVGPITQAVITVPAYFDDTRRKATQDAGRIAGLDVLDIIDEPSAAALAYTFQVSPGADVLADTPRTVLVYDLGGGTFDVTLVKLGRKRFQVLGIEGDVRLGGKDWDDRLVNHVADQFQKQFGTDPREDAQSIAMLQSAAERAKRTLSKVEQTTVTCAHGGYKLSVPVTRNEFDNLTRDLLLRTRLTAQQVVDEAKLTWEQVDKVLLVGGSTHMLMCHKMLRDLTGKEADRSLAVSEVVARGAAVHAGIAAARQAKEKGLPGGAEILNDVVEISVNAHSLGVEIRTGDERVNNKLVPKNTQLPAAVSRVYFTAKDYQSKVRVRVLQGEAHQAVACIPVGECWIDGLPPDLPKGAPVQVRCGVAANGLIEVMALDMTSGRMARAEIHRSGGLSVEDIAKEAEWVKQLQIQ